MVILSGRNVQHKKERLRIKQPNSRLKFINLLYEILKTPLESDEKSFQKNEYLTRRS